MLNLHFCTIICNTENIVNKELKNMPASKSNKVVNRLEMLLSCEQPNANFFKSDIQDAISLLKTLEANASNASTDQKVA